MLNRMFGIWDLGFGIFLWPSRHDYRGRMPLPRGCLGFGILGLGFWGRVGVVVGALRSIGPLHSPLNLIFFICMLCYYNSCIGIQAEKGGGRTE